MFRHTLEVLSHVPAVGRVLVVSGDSHALAVARRHGARTVSEPGRGHLNRALARATALARDFGATAVLVLPADLPLLETSDVESLISSVPASPSVVLAPDRRGDGTNALLVSPPGLIEYEFGHHSFRKHREAAMAAGARVVVCRRASLGHDVDVPEDLERLPARS
jgi:2-phospho-L-lactate guanylyltransferase